MKMRSFHLKSNYYLSKFPFCKNPSLNSTFANANYSLIEDHSSIIYFHRLSNEIADPVDQIYLRFDKQYKIIIPSHYLIFCVQANKHDVFRKQI